MNWRKQNFYSWCTQIHTLNIIFSKVSQERGSCERRNLYSAWLLTSALYCCMHGIWMLINTVLRGKTASYESLSDRKKEKCQNTARTRVYINHESHPSKIHEKKCTHRRAMGQNSLLTWREMERMKTLVSNVSNTGCFFGKLPGNHL